MPVLPQEDKVGSKDLGDAVQKGTQGAKDTADQTKATIEQHKANPGPVMGQDLGEPASKEELRKRAEELNK
ncbi:hypothetical protein EJ03DRAFT_347643 [Teratosphaeria nubilosa]|uniref:Uncharacterized protein n=1 Tax=Teratosphaeria nubilosa TaxID=161662 RepID=A0A6G1LM87_9PEZI|nr:hypothetical protein EJ03DRAFT_347643 [Teratosphaeria nubilosa]